MVFADLSTSNFSKEGDCLRLRGRFEAREGALEEDFSPKREQFFHSIFIISKENRKISCCVRRFYDIFSSTKEFSSLYFTKFNNFSKI